MTQLKLSFRLIELVTFIILASLLVTACDDSSKEDTSPVDAGSTDDKTIIIGTTNTINNLDPADAYDNGTWQLMDNISKGLYAFRPGSTAIEPALAEGPPEISADGLEYTIKIKPGILFADGTELTSDAFVYGYTRSIAIQAAMEEAGLMGQEGLEVHWLFVAYLANLEAVDTYTLKYTLKQPYSFFTALLCQPLFMPVNPNYYPADKIHSSPYQQIDDPTLWAQFNIDQTTVDSSLLMGIGPYRVVSITGDPTIGDYGAYTEVVLEKNPSYFGTPPKNDKIIVKYYQTAAELLAAVKNGTVDVAEDALRPQDYLDLKDDPNLLVIDASGVVIRFMVFNLGMPPYNNNTLRQAISYAVDREAAATDVFLGNAVPLHSMIPNGMWGHTDAFPPKNTSQAQAMLNGLVVDVPTETPGETEPFTISATNKLVLNLSYSYDSHYGETEPDFALAIKTALEETGMITVNLEPVTWDQYKIQFGQMGMFLLGWYPDYVDPDTYTFPVGHSQGNDWVDNDYENPQMDSLLVQAQTTTDDLQREQLYAQIQALWAQDIPTLPMVQVIEYVVTQTDIRLTAPSTASVFYFDLIERVPAQ